MNNPEGLTRGYKKKERTRRKLVETAIDMVGSQDIGSLTLLGLAEASEMSNGTVYNYFATKEDLLSAVAEEVSSKFSEFIAAVEGNGDRAAERVSMGIRMHIQRAKEDPKWARALLRLVSTHIQVNSAVVAFIANDVQMGIDQTEFDVEDQSTAVSLIVGAGLIAIRAVLEGWASPNIDREMPLMVLKGLGVKKRDALKIVQLPMPDLVPIMETTLQSKRGRPRKVA